MVKISIKKIIFVALSLIFLYIFSSFRETQILLSEVLESFYENPSAPAPSLSFIAADDAGETATPPPQNQPPPLEIPPEISFLRPPYILHPSVPASERTEVRETDAFSACMLVKDDNTILPEWLAYHYVSLPLRHLVVTVDPNSRTTPESVLRTWGMGSEYDPSGRDGEDERGKFPRMNIEMWTDADVFPDKTPLQRRKFADLSGLSMEEAKERHRIRQPKFMDLCMQHHKRAGRKWVILADSDEYVTFSPSDENDGESEWSNRVNWDNPLTDDAERNWWYRKFTYQISVRKTVLPPAMDGSTTVARHVLSEEAKHWYGNETGRGYPWIHDDSACLVLPRVFYSAAESPMETIASAVPPDLWENYPAENLNSIRFRFNAGRNQNKLNLLGKSIVDVSRVPMERLTGGPNIHKPIEGNDICTRAYARYDASTLRLNHYLGSWEQHQIREDVRRSKEHFDWKANVRDSEDDVIRPWLKVFYDQFGERGIEEYLLLPRRDGKQKADT
uniref:Uncharacterized protein n=1 Tax=Corethron hystrix TaxID=216773 RepID=A0A7S1BBQ3_9STRA|mmetsp:Transcript_20701/g.46966  ORF Transcript_20701/g.46966 Transcript_20701/m.46966 type:complete len:504 (+) Transcript_20701:81-1592(+)